MSTFGPTFDHIIDGPRIRNQHEVIKNLMLRSGYLTLSEISHATGFPEASISAQIRHIKKKEFWPPQGRYVVTRNRRHGGTWEYMVRFDKDREQMVLF